MTSGYAILKRRSFAVLDAGLHVSWKDREVHRVDLALTSIGQDPCQAESLSGAVGYSSANSRIHQGRSDSNH